MQFDTTFLILLLIPACFSVKIDYYWKPYNGEVPDDAFVAGKDTAGKLIYVGQGFFINTGLLPGTLRAGSAVLKVTAYEIVLTTNKNIKILCCRQPWNLRWVSMNYSNLARMTNVHFVDGGTEMDSVVYIGRGRHEGNIEIGKVFNLSPSLGLTLPNHLGKSTLYKDFDILTYEDVAVDIRQGTAFNDTTSLFN